MATAEAADPITRGRSAIQNLMASHPTIRPRVTESLAQDSKSSEAQPKKAKKVKVNPLPSPSKIYNAIPAEGIDIGALTSRFKAQIDETNANLFMQMVKSMSTFEKRIIVKPLPQMPSPSHIKDLIKAAKEQPPRVKCSEIEVTSRFISPIEITFSEHSELIRGASNILPPRFYRCFHETSATLCCFVSTDTHTKRREMPDVRLASGNAFQALGHFSIDRDLTKDRIERHLVWNRKKDPSSFISAFNHLNHAKRRAEFHYQESERIGHRVCVAEISSKDLVAATVHGKIRVTTNVFVDGNWTRTTETSRDVQIPIWVRKTACLVGDSRITSAQLESSGADIWLSITELRQSDLKSGFGKGHDYEWLACGRIPKTQIKRVMPYDGNRLHVKDNGCIVRSIGSPEPWIFNWKEQMWRLAKQNDVGNTGPKKRMLEIDAQVCDDYGNKRQHMDKDHQSFKMGNGNRALGFCPKCSHCVNTLKDSTAKTLSMEAPF